MSDYSAEHASALADVTAAGAAVTFSKRSGGTYNPSTDASSGETAADVAGYAMRVKGDTRRYVALGLVESESPTLFFVPSTYGSRPVLGASVSWSGASYTVKDIAPLEPDGTLILARVIVGV